MKEIRYPKDEECVRNICYLFYLSTPYTDAREIYEEWHNHKVLKDYERPDFNLLKIWVGEFEDELVVNTKSYGRV